MCFSITISPEETSQKYGINSSRGYVLKSENFIDKSEIIKIKKILAAFVELKIADENMKTRLPKFNQYVAWRPEEEWEEQAEYQYYKRATERLSKANQGLIDVKCKYNVVIQEF